MIPWIRTTIRGERPNWGLAPLMRPTKAAPAVPFVICRYANARTLVLAIIAALWPGGTIQFLRASLTIINYLLTLDVCIDLNQPMNS